MTPAPRTLALLATLTALTVLTGCATRWVVDSEVRSHSRLQQIEPGAAYRFERLPSQQASERSRAAQENLEALAAPALQAAGLRRDDAHARYSVELSARVLRQYAPWGDPWRHGAWGPWGPWSPYSGWGPGWGPGWYSGWPGYGFPPDPWYRREVSVVMRALPGREVVYESRARHDGPYHRSQDLWPAMFQAALQGFPNPPAEVRQVRIELRRDAPAPVGAPAATEDAATPAVVAPATR